MSDAPAVTHAPPLENATSGESYSQSLNSDDEYHYSDYEEEEDEDESDGNGAMSHQQQQEQQQYEDDGDDDEEYQYSDDNASVSSDSTPAGGRRSHSAMHPETGEESSLSRLSPGASAAKKKRVSPSDLQHMRAHAQAEYRVIDEEELFVEQRNLIHEITQVLEISPSVAAILLRRFGWDKEKLFEGYYMDPVKARHDAGVEFADTPAVYPEGQLVRVSLGLPTDRAWRYHMTYTHTLAMICCVAVPDRLHDLLRIVPAE